MMDPRRPSAGTGCATSLLHLSDPTARKEEIMSDRSTGAEAIVALPMDDVSWDEDKEALISERVQSVRRYGRRGGPPLRPCLSVKPEDLPRRYLEEGTQAWYG
jgi:hypothetical protein